MDRHAVVTLRTSTQRILAGMTLVALLGLGLSQPAWAGHRYVRSAFQVVNFHAFGDASVDMPGAATLRRTWNGLEASIHASGLDPNTAYTIWWAIFHHPAACASSPCTGQDLRNPAVGGANFYATGFLTGPDGMANVYANLRSGRLPMGVDSIDLGTGISPRLMPYKGLQAEVHIILRSHGPFQTGVIAHQIGTGEFDCGPTCSNQQAAVFLPVK